MFPQCTEVVKRCFCFVLNVSKPAPLVLLHSPSKYCSCHEESFLLGVLAYLTKNVVWYDLLRTWSISSPASALRLLRR